MHERESHLVPAQNVGRGEPSASQMPSSPQASAGFGGLSITLGIRDAGMCKSGVRCVPRERSSPHVVRCVLLSPCFLLHAGRWRSFRYLYSGWFGFIAATSRLDGVPSSVITSEWRAAWNRTVQRTIVKAQTHTTLRNMRRRAPTACADSVRRRRASPARGTPNPTAAAAGITLARPRCG